MNVYILWMFDERIYYKPILTILNGWEMWIEVSNVCCYLVYLSISHRDLHIVRMLDDKYRTRSIYQM